MGVRQIVAGDRCNVILVNQLYKKKQLLKGERLPSPDFCHFREKASPSWAPHSITNHKCKNDASSSMPSVSLRPIKTWNIVWNKNWTMGFVIYLYCPIFSSACALVLQILNSYGPLRLLYQLQRQQLMADLCKALSYKWLPSDCAYQPIHDDK